MLWIKIENLTKLSSICFFSVVVSFGCSQKPDSVNTTPNEENQQAGILQEKSEAGSNADPIIVESNDESSRAPISERTKSAVLDSERNGEMGQQTEVFQEEDGIGEGADETKPDNDEASGRETVIEESVDEEVLKLSEFQIQRQERWNEKQKWVFVYDGTDSISDHASNHHKWENPIDDDFVYCPNTSFKLNFPSKGFMTVNRKMMNNPDKSAYPHCHVYDDFTDKTGNLAKRDEYLSHQLGFTLEIRLKIFDDSDPGSYYMQVINDKAGYEVLLGHNSIRMFDGDKKKFKVLPHWIAGQFNVFRMVKHPGLFSFDLYLNEKLVGSGIGDTRIHTNCKS